MCCLSYVCYVAAKDRNKSNGDEMTVEFMRNAEQKAKRKKEDEDRNNKVCAI